MLNIIKVNDPQVVDEGANRRLRTVIIPSKICQLSSYFKTHPAALKNWLVVVFGLNGPLRQYFSLYRAVSQREGERKLK